MGLFYWVICLVVAELVVEHRLANPEEPAAIDAAFFNANALVSMSLLAGVVLSYIGV